MGSDASFRRLQHSLRVDCGWRNVFGAAFKTQRLMQQLLVARPSRIPDAEFADEVQRHLDAEHLSMSALAAIVGVDKATLSRSLRAKSFSSKLRRRLRNVIDSSPSADEAAVLLRKALLLMSAADRLRERAGQMLIDALDQSAARK